MKQAKRTDAQATLGPVSLRGESHEIVFNFVDLGSGVQCDGACAVDMKHRTYVEVGRFASLRCIWKEAGFPHSMKARLFKIAIQSTMTHGCDTAHTTQLCCRTNTSCRR